MSRSYDYKRKRPFSGHRDESRRETRKALILLIVGAGVLAFVIHLILIKP